MMARCNACLLTRARNDSRNDCSIDCARGIFNFAFCFEWISGTPVAKIKSEDVNKLILYPSYR